MSIEDYFAQFNPQVLNTGTAKQNYNKAPLPFLGQKAKFLQKLEERLGDFDLSGEVIFVDVFGGSGLLSHRVKQLYPHARVIWNDYDNYFERLQHRDETSELVQQLARFRSTVPHPRKLAPEDVETIKELIREHYAKYNYVDHITISSCLLFNGNYSNSLHHLLTGFPSYYNQLRLSLAESKGYLNGVERICCDGFELLEYLSADRGGVDDFMGQIILFIDPPYISSHFQCYKSNYWDLAKFAELERALFENKKHAYIIFGSDKADTAFYLQNANVTRKTAMLKACNLLDCTEAERAEFEQHLEETFRPLYRTDTIMQSISKFTANPSEYSLDNFEYRLKKK